MTITLIILTYREPEHLKRALEFYKKSMPLAKIIVVDSHSNDGKERTRKYVHLVTTETYKPLHLEYDSSISFSEKIAKSIDCVTTPYSLLVGDDDFFSPQGIAEALDFLENHSEYIFCYGHNYGFIFDGIDLKWYCSGFYENPRSFTEDDPLERLDAYLIKYATTFYSVFRTDMLKRIIREAFLYAPELVFFDNMFTMQALLRGKGYFLNKPFWFKEMSNLATSVTYNTTWFLGRNFEDNKRLMEKGLAENFIMLFSWNAAYAYERARGSVDTFMETTFYSMYPECQPQSFFVLQKNKIKKLLPHFLKKKILFLKNKLKSEKINVGQEHLTDVISPYFQEFKEIATAIKESKVIAYRDGFEDAKQL